MNYITEINKFYDWLETNPISDSSIILWHALMHINNKSGWRQEFTVAISTLELKTSLSKSSILRARNILQQLGRLSFKSRSGQQSAIYTLVAFHTGAQSEAQTGTQSEAQSEAQTGTQTVPINKQNKTKQKVLFNPPGLQEVRAYFNEKGFYESVADKFFEYYSTANWHDSKGSKVKNWKQKAQAVWFKDENKIKVPVKQYALQDNNHW